MILRNFVKVKVTTKETESESSIETYEVKTKASNSLEKFRN